jgi:hypothetical protein
MQQEQEQSQPQSQPQKPKKEEEDLETLEEQTRIQLLARGMYTCRTKPTQSSSNEPQYQNRIQMKNEITENAEKISAMLKTIKEYNLYFQPILETETIKLGKITEDNIEECEKITEAQQLQEKRTQMNLEKFVSLKTRYYGETWQQQMIHVKHSQPKKTLIVFINSILHMTQTLKYLQNKSIVHFNVNKQTVLASHVRILPILANYNLSFQMDDLKKEDEMETLFPNYEEYAPWPIEVYLASRIANIKEEMMLQTTNASAKEEWKLRFVQKEEIEEWIKTFTESPLFMKIASEERRELMRIQWTEYFKPIINNPLKSFYENLLQSAYTWDTYGMCILWLETMILLELHEKLEYDFMRDFVSLLKTVIYANPAQRHSAEYLEKEITKIFMNVDQITYEKFIAGTIL